MPVQTNTIIQFSGLKSGKYDFEFQLGKPFFERFENEEMADGNVTFQVQMERKERLLLFKMSFQGNVITQCDRCLGEMAIPVEGSPMLTVQISDNPNDESEDENVITLPEKESQIDLGQWMYEHIAIAMPMRHIHPDDANGNSTCDPAMLRLLEQHQESEPQGEQPIDPRWSKLFELKDK